MNEDLRVIDLLLLNEHLRLQLKFKTDEVKMLRQGVAMAFAGFLLMWGLAVWGYGL